MASALQKALWREGGPVGSDFGSATEPERGAMMIPKGTFF
jgi:hypothetical protein